MDIIRLWAWGYVVLFCVVVLTGYIPQFIDQNNMILGLFRRTWYADGLRWIVSLFAHREWSEPAPDITQPDEIVAEARHRFSTYY